MVCRKCSDEGRKGPPGRFPPRSGKGYGYCGVGKSVQSSKGGQPRGDGSMAGVSDEDDGREGEVADVAPGDRAGDAGASCGEQRSISCTAARAEATRSRPDPSCTASDRTQLKAATESRDKLMKKHSPAVEGVQILAAQLQARQTELEELAIALRDKAHLVEQLQERVRVEELAELPSALPGCVLGGMSALQWAEGLTAALAGSQATSFRDWMAGCQLATTRSSIEDVSDLDDDELWRRMNQVSTVCGVVSVCGASTGQPSVGGSAQSSTPTRAQSSHTDARKPRRREREGEGCRGQRRAAHEGLRSVSDAAFPLCPCRGRASPGSSRDTQSRCSCKGGQHSHTESGVGRLSHGSLVTPKGGHAECPDTPVRMSDVLRGIQRRR